MAEDGAPKRIEIIGGTTEAAPETSPPSPVSGNDSFPSPQDIAVLEIDGMQYGEWESVSVRHAYYDVPFVTARFTCSEAQPIAANYAALRILPGQWCKVYLGGQLMMSGYVATRQVFYDAFRHYVEIQAVSNVASMAYTSIISKTHELKNVTAEQAIRSWLAPSGIQFRVEGGALPSRKFPRIAHAPGTPIIEMVETVLRQLGSYPLRSNPQGELVVEAGESSQTDTVTEGIDILEGREIIQNLGMAKGSYGIGEQPGNDKTNMTKSAHEVFKANPYSNAAVEQYAPQVIAAEHPGDVQNMSGRANAEQLLQTQDTINVIITVRGWFKPSGGIWTCGQKVMVKSPMLVMDGSIDLKAKTITYSQDNRRGTRTVLELANPLALDKMNVG